MNRIILRECLSSACSCLLQSSPDPAAVHRRLQESSPVCKTSDRNLLRWTSVTARNRVWYIWPNMRKYLLVKFCQSVLSRMDNVYVPKAKCTYKDCVDYIWYWFAYQNRYILKKGYRYHGLLKRKISGGELRRPWCVSGLSFSQSTRHLSCSLWLIGRVCVVAWLATSKWDTCFGVNTGD